MVRALAVGAKAAFAGRAFLYGLGAIGGEGAGLRHRPVQEEIRNTLRQCGMQHGEGRAQIESSSGRVAILTCSSRRPAGARPDLGTCTMDAYVAMNPRPICRRPLARRNAPGACGRTGALAGGNNTVILATGGIVGAMLAPDKRLATLPISI